MERARERAREEKETRAHVRSGRVSFSRRHENDRRERHAAEAEGRTGGRSVTLGRRSGTRRDALFRRVGPLVRRRKLFFGVSNFRRFFVLH